MTLGVVHGFRQCGIGSVLVSKLEAIAAGARRIYSALFLHVLGTNTSAINFYLKLGFEQHRLLIG